MTEWGKRLSKSKERKTEEAALIPRGELPLVKRPQSPLSAKDRFDRVHSHFQTRAEESGVPVCTGESRTAAAGLLEHPWSC